MVTTTTTRVQEIQGPAESNAPEHNAWAIVKGALDLEIERVLQTEKEATRKTLAVRRRVDSAFEQVASYW